jgi:type IV pilus assembly protein PilO
VIREFYAELPIEVRVLGKFSNFGSFVSGLSSLPRIVTVRNIKITPNGTAAGAGNKNDKFPLTMNALVRTYRYLEEGEGAGKPPAKAQTR